MATIRTVILSLLVVYLGYGLYKIPVPEGAAQPLKLRISFAVNELFMSGTKWLDYLGIANEVDCLRWGMSTKAALVNHFMPLTGIETLDTAFDGVRVRVYTPRGADHTRTGLVYFHGGGWILGSVDTHHGTAGHFAKETNVVVVSVEYRLNPEHTKRDGLDDCIAATRYFIRNAEKFGVDPERVAIGGDSAGGNYAGGVALYLRDNGFSPMPKIQMLIYPSFQAIDMELPSYQQNQNGPVLTKYLLCLFRSNIYIKSKAYMNYFDTNTHVPGYVRVAMAQGILSHDIIPDANKYPPYVKPDFERGGSEIWDDIKDAVFDPYNCPLMAENHSGLPKTYIFTSQHDPLRDEGYLYAHKLRQDGVDVTHYNCPVCWHGMVETVMSDKDSKEAVNKMVDFLKVNL